MKCRLAGMEFEWLESPSMRREWIEMTKVRALYCQMVSPSMRREWIEMAKLEEKSQADFVSLHAEGVD